MHRVLVVDDVPDNITLLTFELEDDNFEVLAASSGQECLDIVKLDPQPDIILLDIHMPGISGIETLQQLKNDEDTQDIPVIMVSAHSAEERIVECIDFGAHDFVSKPIEYPVLAARMRSALRLSQALQALENANNALNVLATTDSLTGAYNRRHFFTLAEKELAKKARYNGPITIIMLDIDHFKAINDKYGHAAGDLALQKVMECLRDVCRSYDIIGRLGGEEFAVCCSQAAMEGVAVLAERIRLACEAMEITFNDVSFHLTVSFGVTELSVDESFDEALHRADTLLYEAKQSGRNRVIAGRLYE